MSQTSSIPINLSGKIAVVTGAAQGLGFAIAEQLAQEGAFLWIADINADQARTAAEKLRNQGLDTNSAHLDISDVAEVAAFFEKVTAESKGLDILVNNAGVGQKICPVVNLRAEEWGRVLGVTLTGTFFCCQAAAKIMERQESGCIVNIASINGQNPAAGAAAYNAAKAGVISLTRTLALELAVYGVRVNAVSPGPVYTQFNKTVMAQRCEILGITEQEMIERVRKSIPLGRWGEATDIARSVAFLCSPAASWITGEVLRVSGGLEGVSAAPPKRTSVR
jgi:NAD(P)-dependent dehydrogenase (short-subunit alcohol dehydrogenase family)